MDNCRISDNTATGSPNASGAGIAQFNGPASFTGTTFINNHASGTTRGRGGGMYVSGTTADIRNCTFIANRATGTDEASGGGLITWNHANSLVNNTFIDNQAISDTQADGGGYYSMEETLVQSNLMVDNYIVEAGVPARNDGQSLGLLILDGYNFFETTINFWNTGIDTIGGWGNIDNGIPSDYGCTTPLPDGTCAETVELNINHSFLDDSSAAGAGTTVDSRGVARPQDITGAGDPLDSGDPGSFERIDVDADGVDDMIDVCPAITDARQEDVDVANATHAWPLNEGFEETTALDAIGTNDGAISGPLWMDAPNGLGLLFNGTSDYIDLGTGINLANTSFSFSFWARRDGSGTHDFVLSQGIAATNVGLHIGFRSNNFFTFGFWGNDLIPSIPYTDSDWHHWAGTYNAATNLRTLYRDGQQFGQDTATADYQGSGTLYLGRYAPGGCFFVGGLDDVALFSRALTQPEVDSIFQNGLGDGVGNDCDNCPNDFNADQANSDNDSYADGCDNCPNDDNETQTNTDGDSEGNVCDADDDNDGVDDGPDCASLDGQLWSAPSEVQALTGNGTVWSWSAPASPGATTPVYQLGRYLDPSNMFSVTCIESNTASTTGTDSSTPASGVVWFYLTGAKNGCGTEFGTNSSGGSRSSTICF